MSNNEQPRRRRRLRGTKVRKGEILCDSRGRVIDDAYVEGAVADALSKVTRGPRGHKVTFIRQGLSFDLDSNPRR